MRKATGLPATVLLACMVLCACKGRKAASVSLQVCGDISKQGIAEGLHLPQSKLEQGTFVYSLDDGITSLTSRAWICDHAQRKLDVQYYIFSKDNVGLIACDFLVRAADRGVKIRMIIDDITVRAGSREIFALDAHENIEIRIYNPGVKFEKNLFTRVVKILTRADQLHRRMHVKTINADDVIAITGGRNIADEYYDYDKRYNFRDRDVLMAGKAVSAVTKTFETYWNDTLCVPFRELTSRKLRNNPLRYDKLHAYACDPAHFSEKMRHRIADFPRDVDSLLRADAMQWTEHVTFVSDPPRKTVRPKEHDSPCADSLLSIIHGAKQAIDVQSPYVIVMEKGDSLLKRVVNRGVKVRILTNSLASTDNDEAWSGYHRDRHRVLEAGADLYEFKPDARVRMKLMNPEVQSAMSYTPVYGLHAKTMLVDGSVTVIGSYNADPRSTNLNTEGIVIIRSPRFTRYMQPILDEEVRADNAWKITPSFNPDKEAGLRKRITSFTRKVVPKRVL